MEPTLPGFNQYCSELMCLAQGHNTVTPVGIEPRTIKCCIPMAAYINVVYIWGPT